MNQWVLMGEGDILLLYTDGPVGHQNVDDEYCPRHLEKKLREVKHQTAAEIFESIKADLKISAAVSCFTSRSFFSRCLGQYSSSTFWCPTGPSVYRRRMSPSPMSTH